MNVGRIETLIIKVVESDGFAKLIDSHVKGEPVSGCIITGFATGNKFEECDKLEEQLFEAEEKYRKLKDKMQNVLGKASKTK